MAGSANYQERMARLRWRLRIGLVVVIGLVCVGLELMGY